MFKGHPSGLFVLAFANLGERFGYYTMLAIFTLFLQDHFFWDESQASAVYGIFLAAIYSAPLLGGLIADAWLGYGKTVTLGLIVMTIGYLLLSQTGASPLPMYIALGVIALGVGLFKGNLAVIVGNLYEKSSVSHLRDAAFNIFYMFINIGAMFAPHAARYLKNRMMLGHGYEYDSGVPYMAHSLLNGTPLSPEGLEKITALAAQKGESVEAFARGYLDALSGGYTLGFAAAGVSMVLSLIIFIAMRNRYKSADYLQRNRPASDTAEKELTPKQTRDRVVALLLVFLIVIFFWMAFHQNGSTLTFFAKNYTSLSVGRYTYLLFTIPTLLAIFSVILGSVAMFTKTASKSLKGLGALFTAGGLGYLAYNLFSLSDSNRIDPELFQAFNPMFVVFLTPVVVGYFSWLNKKGKEPSAPKKIGIGMTITTLAFGLMLYASIGLPGVQSLSGSVVDASLAVSPYWLISTYFALTVAELCLSPMGLSFVSKVAPPKLRGTMQAGWLCATAIGNYLAGFVGRFYMNWELWQFFLLLILVAAVSAIIMFSIMKIIRRASES